MKRTTSFLLIILLFGSTLSILSPRAGSASELSTILLDPSSCSFKTNSTKIGDRFNVTAWVDNVTDLAAAQICLEFNDSILHVARWFEPVSDPQYIFAAKTTSAYPTPPDPGYTHLSPNRGKVQVAINLFPAPPAQLAANGSGKVCVFEFEITGEPQFDKVFSSGLNISSPNTFLLNSEGNEIPSAEVNGYYTYVKSMPNLPTIRLDPSSNVFNESTKAGTLFTVTVWIDNVVDLAAWQVHLEFNDSILQVTSWSPLWSDPESIFAGKTTSALPNPPDPVYVHYEPGRGGVQVASSLFPPPPAQASVNGSGKACTFEFNITKEPGPGELLFSWLSINNPETLMLYSNGTDMPCVKMDGYYSCGTGPPAFPYFNIIVTPEKQTISPGETAPFVVAIRSLNGFSGTVDLSAHVGNGLSCVFYEGTVTPPSNGLVESVLFVTAEDNMLLANHTYPVSIKGESSELVGWAEAELTIVPPPSALKITNAFSPLQVNPGQEFYVSVTVSYSFESDTSLRIEIVNSTTKTALASPKEDTVSGADYNVYDFNLTSPESLGTFEAIVYASYFKDGIWIRDTTGNETVLRILVAKGEDPSYESLRVYNTAYFNVTYKGQTYRAYLTENLTKPAVSPDPENDQAFQRFLFMRANWCVKNSTGYPVENLDDYARIAFAAQFALWGMNGYDGMRSFADLFNELARLSQEAEACKMVGKVAAGMIGRLLVASVDPYFSVTVRFIAESIYDGLKEGCDLGFCFV